MPEAEEKAVASLVVKWWLKGDKMVVKWFLNRFFKGKSRVQWIGLRDNFRGTNTYVMGKSMASG